MSTRALLIEDNEQNRYLVTFLLEKHDFIVTHAANGPTGISLAQREKFDIVLLDIQLPGMHGYDVARALRTLSAMADVPIVAVTSYAMVGDREKSLESGCTGYIEKPINPDTFASEIQGFLRSDPKD